MKVFHDALEARLGKLPNETTCYRWVDEELPGITVDRFGSVAVLSLYRELEAHEREEDFAAALKAFPGIESVYVKRRPKEAQRVANESPEQVAPPLPVVGPAVETIEVQEQGVRFEIRPSNGLSVGLYLDARDARAFVRREAKGRRVLNTFAYTCGFGVAARLGGAARAVNVDTSRKVLDWGGVNLSKNGLEPHRQDFVSGDTFDWLALFERKNERFELLILDPPGFATTRSSRFSARRDYHRLVHAGAPLVAPGGWLLAMCNVEQSDREFDDQLRRGVGSRNAREVTRFGASAVDYRQPSALKCVVIELG